MSNNRNNYQQQLQPAQRQYQSQPSPSPSQLQSVQRQHQSQLIQRQQLNLQPRQGLQQQQQQKQDQQKKKTCRGNRKLQRFRAKLRKRGLNNETITTLINDYNNTDQGQNDEQSIVSDMDMEVLVPLRDQVGSKSQSNELFYFSLKITGNTRKH
jgi:hypothetical protein